MSIKTKSILSYEQIEAMVEHVFHGCTIAQNSNAVQELTEGLCNTAYMVKLMDGREVVLKIAPPPEVEYVFYEKNMMQAEVECLRLVGNQTSVPVPKVYGYDDSKQLCPSAYFFMEKLTGSSLNSIQSNLSEQEKKSIYYTVGKYNAQMNRIEGEYFGYPAIPELQFATMEELYRSLIEHILADGSKKAVDIGVAYETILEQVKKHLDALNVVEKPYFVHWDLWEGNVFVSENEVNGIIDFERALYADPLMEYFFQAGRESNQDFLAGYEKLSFTENEMERRTLYNIFLYLVMIVECPYRQYDNDWQYNWAKDMLMKELKKLSEY